MRIGIIGGSYGGLSAALALRCVGHDVRIFERTTAFDRIGGGIVVQPDFAEYLESFGYARPEAVGVSTTRRRFLARDGSVKHTTSDSVFYTAWDVLLRSMRAAFDAERIRNSMTLHTFLQTPQGVECTFENGENHTFDLLVASDGIGSTIRQILFPEVSPVYAGYVAYRGLVPENELSPEQTALIQDSFVLFDYPHSHILNYLIPGEAGSILPGERR
jgi:2-polyprenyl-6-methoxyphenol hydroxylase-like FAD-dependent oxidoreductase